MNGPILQLLILAAIAIFLISKLRSVLGTRDGFEKPALPPEPAPKPNLTVVDTGVDRDIDDHVSSGSDAARALAAMKRVDPSFAVGEFLSGARGAYEMILMGFETGKIQDLQPFISAPVYDGFRAEIDARTARGEIVDASFIGVSGVDLVDADFDDTTKTAEITVTFKGELTHVTRDASGTIIQGDPAQIVKQRDSWTFARQMESQNPNWQLVATSL